MRVPGATYSASLIATLVPCAPRLCSFTGEHFSQFRDYYRKRINIGRFVALVPISARVSHEGRTLVIKWPRMADIKCLDETPVNYCENGSIPCGEKVAQGS